MTNLLIMLLSWSVLFVGYDEQNPIYEGKILSEWKTQTQPQFTLSERKKAILAMVYLARERIDRRQPGDVAWVEGNIVPTLVELFHDKEPTIRMIAANSFYWFPSASKSATNILNELLNDHNEEVRVTAAGALISIEPKDTQRVIPMLVNLVKTTASDVARHKAAQQLARIRPDGVHHLEAMLNENNSDVRQVALETLLFVQRATPQALPNLIKLLRDKDVQIRRYAVGVISQIRPISKEATSAIIPLIQDKDAYVRSDVLRGLSEMHADIKEVLPEMIKLVNDDNGLVRKTLADSLGAMGPEAVPTLTILLGDKLAYVRGYAADSLGRIGPAAKDAVPTLKRLLTDMSPVRDEGMRVCHHVGRALVKILNDKSYLEDLPTIPLDGK